MKRHGAIRRSLLVGAFALGALFLLSVASEPALAQTNSPFQPPIQLHPGTNVLSANFLSSQATNSVAFWNMNLPPLATAIHFAFNNLSSSTITFPGGGFTWSQAVNHTCPPGLAGCATIINTDVLTCIVSAYSGNDQIYNANSFAPLVIMPNFTAFLSCVVPPTGLGQLAVQITGGVTTNFSLTAWVETGRQISSLNFLPNFFFSCLRAGTFPGGDMFVWNNSFCRIGKHLSKAVDEGNGSEDEFAVDIETTLDSSNVAIPAFKGPLFLVVSTNDPSTNAVQHSANALTSFTHILTGNTAAFAEGAVVVVDTQGTGDGQMQAGEFDINNNTSADASAFNNCDSSPITVKCKMNFYLGSGGTHKGSWVLFTGNSGPGWNGGIRVNNITSGNQALSIQNSRSITGDNAAGTSPIGIAFVDTSNNTVIGSGANNVQIPTGFFSSTFANLPASSNGSVYGCSDCTSPSNPCVGGGMGALAVRQGGAWVCK